MSTSGNTNSVANLSIPVLDSFSGLFGLSVVGNEKVGFVCSSIFLVLSDDDLLENSEPLLIGLNENALCVLVAGGALSSTTVLVLVVSATFAGVVLPFSLSASFLSNCFSMDASLGSSGNFSDLSYDIVSSISFAVIEMDVLVLQQLRLQPGFSWIAI